MDNIKISSKQSLNKKARAFLLDHCISKRAADILAGSFTGYINGDFREDVTLHRQSGKWEITLKKESILSINGELEGFYLLKSSIS